MWPADAGSLGRLDGAGGGGAGRQAHDASLVRPLLEEVDGREVEVELRHRGVGEVPDDRLDHRLAARARPQHGAGHVAQRTQQAVALLEPMDQALSRQHSPDQLGACPEQDIRCRRAAHCREPVAAEHDQVAMRLTAASERIDRDGVEVGGRGDLRHRSLQRRLPLRARGPLDAAGSGDRGVSSHELEAGAVRRELIDGGGVELAGKQQVRKRDRHHAAELFHIGARVAGRGRQQRCEAAESFEGGSLGGRQP